MRGALALSERIGTARDQGGNICLDWMGFQAFTISNNYSHLIFFILTNVAPGVLTLEMLRS